MSTISRNFVVHGYCPIDKNDVAIEVEYISFSVPNEDKRHKKFVKGNNRCFYLSEGKCSRKDDCPVYKEAATERYEDFSKIHF